MAGNVSMSFPRAAARSAQRDPLVVRTVLLGLAVAIMGLFIVVPLLNVFSEALANGPGAYWRNLVDDADTWSAIRLTLTVAPIAVALNLIFGLAAAWAIARFRFRGRALLTSMIDLPFAVSPVVAGLIFVLIFGLQGFLGPWLREDGIKIIFATPGLVLATAFVTFPFVARELIPVMEAIGADEEIAAVSLGAGGWPLFRRVTLPTSTGACSTASFCATRAPWASSAPSTSSPVGSPGNRHAAAARREALPGLQHSRPPSPWLAPLSLALVTLAMKTVLEWKTRNELQGRVRESVADSEGESTGGHLRLLRDCGWFEA